jgi:hypothetical protein
MALLEKHTPLDWTVVQPNRLTTRDRYLVDPTQTTSFRTQLADFFFPCRPWDAVGPGM